MLGADHVLSSRSLEFVDEVRALTGGEGVFAPLPYRSFGHDEVRDAFRVMQQSLHVGKIVVTPPSVAEIPETTAAAFTAAADGTHLIVGGLGGFGLATAAWLAEHGARHL